MPKRLQVLVMLVRESAVRAASAKLSMILDLDQSAAQHWGKPNKSEWLAVVMRGVSFVDGIKEVAA